MFETVQQCVSRFGKGAFTHMAHVSLLVARVDVNPSTCSTRGIGTYYKLQAHWEGGVGCICSPVKTNASGEIDLIRVDGQSLDVHFVNPVPVDCEDNNM